MKKLLTTATTALAAALTIATTTATAENIGAFCRGIHATSEFIMLERQNHESMPDMIAATAQISDDKAANTKRRKQHDHDDSKRFLGRF